MAKDAKKASKNIYYIAVIHGIILLLWERIQWILDLH